ncbi:MAG: hypothetical protein Q7R69_03165 [bacterium]|nr:hypothetical protein [bacterium]
MDIITKAKEFASHAHKDHVRNDEAKTPYIFHLAEVAGLVKESGGNNQEISSAWLHDTVEERYNEASQNLKRIQEQVRT